MPQLILSHIDLIRLIGGLLALFLGGEALIRGATALADKLGVPKLVIGVTIIGFGTSLPELLVALQAGSQGAPDIALGNIIGSNIANLLLILTMGALILPVVSTARNLRRDALVMLLATGGLIWCAWRGQVTRLDGEILTGALALYLLIVLMGASRAKIVEAAPIASLPIPRALLYLLAGMAGLILGADQLVIGASHLARHLGVSEAVIGLTVVALGTSLPELTVSVISALRRQNEVALGNVIGSNIFNILGILGIAAWVRPMAVSPHFLRLDLPLLAGASLVVVALVLRGRPLGRIFALVGLVTYALYCAWIMLGAEAIKSQIAALIANVRP
ncbi:MAG TPA: calcium/sodium antiporter [Asticcacaulis sp.]|nr:calcium/sodium antiporter [Asticcacaulis sp.]